MLVDVTPRRVAVIAIVLCLGAAAAAFLSLSIGSVGIPLPRVLHLLLHPFDPRADADARILFDVRIPRVLLSACVGGGLALAGVIFQVLLRNVLADPYILGVSGGASAGALTAIVTGLSTLFPGATSVCAFIGAGAVVLLVLLVSGARSSQGNVMLLTGVMAGAFLGAVILVLVTISGDQVRSALFWLLGYLGGATMESGGISLIVLAGSFVYLLWNARALNVLSLGAEQAVHLGINLRRTHAGMYVVSSLLTAVLVSYAGSIGFVGLIVPHACRLVVGPDHRVLLPSSVLVGAIIMMLSDLLARSLLAPAEIPVGAVTAAIGAPLFVYLLRRTSI